MSLINTPNLVISMNDIRRQPCSVSLIPLSLYIHIPWCVKKCPYCDFNSHTLPSNPNSLETTLLSPDSSLIFNESLFDIYVDALIQDINCQLPFIQNRQISSIFIGGGTPSLLPIKQYRRLFNHLNTVLNLSNGIEVTMEANPGTLEHAPFDEYLEVGINRLSIGVQSFNDTKLKALGRIHDAHQAFTAIQSARKAGFNRLNVDLMHGLPEQTTEQALQDIDKAHSAGATHISWYQLTIEPNTVFYRDTPILPNEDNLADIEQQGSALLSRLGYQNYEVSAWAGITDSASRHNLNYWEFGDYLAIGAGAHGKVTLIGDLAAQYKSYFKHRDESHYQHPNQQTDQDSKQMTPYRFSKSRLPKDYVSYGNYPKMIGWQAIEDAELQSEFMLNALRLTDGVAFDIYGDRTGKSIVSILPKIRLLQDKGLLTPDKTIIKTTVLGRRYLNQVLQAFI